MTVYLLIGVICFTVTVWPILFVKVFYYRIKRCILKKQPICSTEGCNNTVGDSSRTGDKCNHCYLMKVYAENHVNDPDPYEEINIPFKDVVKIITSKRRSCYRWLSNECKPGCMDCQDSKKLR